MTEAELTREVARLARARGLLWHHCRDSRHCDGPRGFPDYLIAGRGLLAAELKGPDGETSAEQDMWLWRLDQLGSLSLRVRVFYPADLEDGTIASELGRLA